MKTKKRVFFGYCRESIDLESGIQIQQNAIEQYCKAYGITIAKMYIDNNRSAFKDRPQFDQMWKKLDDVDGIVCSRLDRFGRNDSDLLYRFNEMKEKGKTLIVIREALDSSNAESEFFLKLLAIFAQRERTLIRERMQAGLLLAKQQGSKSGKPCHRPKIEVDMAEFHRLHDKGLSIRDCARMMNLRPMTMYRRVKESELNTAK